MSLDPVIAAVLAQLPPLDASLTVEQMRAYTSAGEGLFPGDARVAARDLAIPGPAGEIPARLYLPPDYLPPDHLPPDHLSPDAGPRPGLVVFYHGGGWVICGLETHDGICRDLSARAGTAVLSVDYRLAPEHPFPAAVEDAWAALRWARDRAEDLGVDPDRLAVAGDSAGGNLAAVMALMARDEGLPLRLQLLVYPATDFSMRRPSFTDNGRGYMLTSDAMEWFEGHYAPDRTDWRASPMLARDHAGVAPAMVLTCEYDPLRDEGNAYAAKLEAAGVRVVNRCYPGLIHGAFSFATFVPRAAEMVDAACSAIREALAAPASAPASSS